MNPKTLWNVETEVRFFPETPLELSSLPFNSTFSLLLESRTLFVLVVVLRITTFIPILSGLVSLVGLISKMGTGTRV